MRLFKSAGYTTLAIDLILHKENTTSRVTFGYRESEAVRAALGWIRQRMPNAKVALVGLSLGAAAAVLGPDVTKADAFVLEAMFADIVNATADRIELRLGPWGRWLAHPLILAGSFWTGVSAVNLRPIDRIGRLAAPVLIIGGVQDPMTPIADTRALFERARSPKELWEVADAGHYDFERHAPAAYRQRVLGFLELHLPQQR